MESKRRAPRQQRSAKSCPGTKVELQFVDVKPGNHDQNQRAATRAVVRANAAHYHWRNNRPPRNKAKAKAGRTAVSCHDARTSPPLLPMKSTNLGASINPFMSYNSHLPRAVVNHCIAFNAQFILPALFPDGPDSVDTRAGLVRMSTSNPYVLHMFITGALLNSQGILGVTLPSHVALDMLKSRAAIVQSLSVALKDPVEACKDINIFAVVALAKTETVHRGLETPLKTPKQGPLKSLQLLNLLSLSEIDPIHLDGLSKLIELKGGLEKIEVPGLAALISLGGIIIATRGCAQPLFPVVRLSPSAPEYTFHGQEEKRFGITDTPNQDLYSVSAMLENYTTMIDDFCRDPEAIPASVLIDHRNTTQHALLSLPPREGRCECYRLAALIYSLLVTFPLPYSVAPFKRLVTRLKTALVEWDGDDYMLLWVLTMGGIGATGLGERVWFTSNFHDAAMRIGVRSWPEARSHIKKGLWHEATNDGDGEGFWLESTG